MLEDFVEEELVDAEEGEELFVEAFDRVDGGLLNIGFLS